MLDLQVGAVFRAVRRRLGLTQEQVARLAGVSQQTISRLERGRLEEVGLRAARRVAAALEIELPLAPRWRGGELHRLLDRQHAAMVDQVVTELRRAGWEAQVEYTFSHFGERGSVDVLGWQAAQDALLMVEVKSRLLDLQDLYATSDRKKRLVPKLLAKERGWRIRAVGQVVVVPSTTFEREVVRRHRASFEAAFPARTVAIRRWLRDPSGSLQGIWFLRPTRAASGMCGSGGPSRMRRPRGKATPLR